MKKQIIRSKKARYASLTAALTVMVVVVTVLFNAVTVAVVNRYSLFTPLIGKVTFDVTDDSYMLLEKAFDDAKKGSGKKTTVQIWFCDVEQTVNREDNVNFYLYHTVKDLAERFDNIQVRYLDIYTNPEPILPYTTVTDAETGEKMTLEVNANSVLVISDDYHRIYDGYDFFAYSSNTAEKPSAYRGEKKMTSAILQAVASKRPIACVLDNHGETFPDYELIQMLDDAGYSIVYTDLYQDEIPENCNLIVCYNPSSDLIADEVSAVSEKEILDDFLSKEGNSFLVFLDNSTPNLPNLEEYLSEWGVSAEYADNGRNGASLRYMVQDSTQSLTSDGYAIYASPVNANNQRFLTDSEYIVFQNATALSVVNKGYLDNQDGTYRNTAGTRTLYPLYQSSENSLAYSNGAVVDGGEMLLMSVTEQKNAKGYSYVGVVSSTRFSSQDYLQSAVYGNSDALLRLIGEVDRRLTTEGIAIQPMNSTKISTITTAQMLQWTLVLSLVPASAVSLVAVVVLVRRRRG